MTESIRMEGCTHAVLVIEGGRVLDRKVGVPAAELAREVLALRSRHGQAAEILVDGAEFDQKAVARIAAEIEPQVVPQRPPARVSGDTLAAVELTHHLIWDTYDRAAKTQAWMLAQASSFTTTLLENNKRLADQASELQKRYQASLAEIDFVAREKMMMDAEASASRYARFLVDKAKAEAEAAQPRRGSGEWVDDLIDGLALALGIMCGARSPKEPWNSN
ncbi:MAG: hypothetical protein JNL82_16180 [Myxococcales bacterium]|nr:hypothetical protein [Myxococcales bacterium]